MNGAPRASSRSGRAWSADLIDLLQVTGNTIASVLERQRAEAALRESEERFRALVETSPDWVWGTDERGVYNYASPRIKGLLGYEPDEILGRTPFDLMPAEEAGRVKAEFGPISQTHRPLAGYENLNRHKDGRLVVLETSAVPVFDADGVFRGYRGVDRDITERKRAEAALRLSQSQLLANLENTPNVAVQWYDEQGRILYWNPASEALYGWKSAETLGKTLDALIHTPEEAAEFVKTLAGIRETGKPFGPYEAHIRRRDGTSGWVLATIFSMPLGEGRIGFVCMDVDITERKHAEEQVRRLANEQRTILNTTSVGISFIRHRRLVWVNPSFSAIFGYSTEELQGCETRLFYARPEDHQTIGREGYARLAQGADYRAEIEMKRKDGAVFWCQLTGQAVNSQSLDEGTIWVFQDITERKRAEEALRESQARLEAAQSTSRMGNWDLDLAGGHGSWSKEMFRLFNVDPAAGVPPFADFLEMVHPDDLGRLLEIQRQVVESGEQGQHEFRTHPARGPVQHFLTIIKAFKDAAGTVRRVGGTVQDITERKMAEQALKESESLLRRSQSVGRLGSIALDARTGDWIGSPGLHELFGIDDRYPKTAESWIPLVHPEDREDIRRYLREHVLAGRNRFEKACRIVRPDNGQERWVFALGELEFDPEGNPVRLIGTIQDITERKAAEQALQRSVSLLLATLESTADGILVVDAAGRIAEFNQRFVELWHVPGEILEARDDQAVLRCVLDQLQEPDAFVAKVRELYTHPAAESFDLLEFKDGRVFERLSRPQLIEGQPVGRVWSFRDVTERKRAEAALRESEQKFRTLFEHMAEGVALHELVCNELGEPVDYRILDANPAYGRHTGLAPEQARGGLASAVYGAGPAPYLKEWAEVARTGQPYVFETFFGPMNRHFHISAVSPKPGFFATVFEDITERKHNEEELRRKNEELERFTYTVSHDLKSPLITIKGFTGALQQDLATGRTERLGSDLKRIADATDKMAELLNDLLELSRVGRIMNPPSDVPLGDLVREVLELLAGPIGEGGVKIEVQPDLPAVHGDRRRLVEVYQNLVENSIRFMGGQRRPRIEIGLQDRDGGRVLFVRDNGAGIEPRYHETVFGLFNKLDAKTPGTGIGLALVRRIIEVHGGKIWVESPGHGQGSTFYFTLPSTPHPRKEASS